MGKLAIASLRFDGRILHCDSARIVTMTYVLTNILPAPIVNPVSENVNVDFHVDSMDVFYQMRRLEKIELEKAIDGGVSIPHDIESGNTIQESIEIFK